MASDTKHVGKRNHGDDKETDFETCASPLKKLKAESPPPPSPKDAEPVVAKKALNHIRFLPMTLSIDALPWSSTSRNLVVLRSPTVQQWETRGKRSWQTATRLTHDQPDDLERHDYTNLAADTMVIRTIVLYVARGTPEQLQNASDLYEFIKWEDFKVAEVTKLIYGTAFKPSFLVLLLTYIYVAGQTVAICIDTTELLAFRHIIRGLTPRTLSYRDRQFVCYTPWLPVEYCTKWREPRHRVKRTENALPQSFYESTPRLLPHHVDDAVRMATFLDIGVTMSSWDPFVVAMTGSELTDNDIASLKDAKKPSSVVSE